MDKRKWALEVLARKKAVSGKTAADEKQEDNAVLKGNYPLLVCTPLPLKPVFSCCLILYDILQTVTHAFLFSPSLVAVSRLNCQLT
jgi:hypothetical protein